MFDWPETCSRGAAVEPLPATLLGIVGGNIKESTCGGGYERVFAVSRYEAIDRPCWRLVRGDGRCLDEGKEAMSWMLKREEWGGED